MECKYSDLVPRCADSNTQDVEDALCTLKLVLEDEKVEGRLVKIYEGVYKAVCRNDGHILYTGLKELINEHLNGMFDENSEMLIVERWQVYRRKCDLIEKGFSYMDRAYCIPKKLDRFSEVLKESFRDRLCLYGKELIEKMAVRVFEIVKNNEETSYVELTIKMLRDLFGDEKDSVYSRIFEKKLLDRFDEFYQKLSLYFLKAFTLNNYLLRSKNLLEMEEKIFTKFFPSRTKEKLLNMLTRRMIEDKREIIVDNNALMLMDHVSLNNTQTFRLIDDVLSIVDGGRTYLYNFFSDMFVGMFESNLLLHKTNESIKYPIPSSRYYTDIDLKFCNFNIAWSFYLAEFMYSLNKFLVDIDCDDRYLMKAKDNALLVILSKNTNSIECVNAAIDYVMREFLFRKECKVNHHLPKKHVIDGNINFPRVFELIEALITLPLDLNLFAKSYKQFFSRRIMLYINIPIEQKLLSIISKHKGKVSVSVLQTMLNDVIKSKLLAKEFKHALVYSLSKLHQCNLSAFCPLVIAGPLWDYGNFSNHKSFYPPGFHYLLNEFESFYMRKNKNRSLSWSPVLGTALVCMYFNDKMVVNYFIPTYAMFILLAFDGVQVSKTLTLDEIHVKVNLPINVITSALSLLSSGINKIVLTEGNSLYRLNTNIKHAYISKIPTFKYSIIQKRQRSDVHNNDYINVKIDSAIMGIVKSNKFTTHNTLVNKCVPLPNSSLLATKEQIELRIKSLIENEFISKKKLPNGVIVYVF